MVAHLDILMSFSIGKKKLKKLQLRGPYEKNSQF
jgi:hypothetical protein